MRTILFNLIAILSVCFGYAQSKCLIICNKPEKLSVINSVTHVEKKLSELDRIKNGYLIKCINFKDISFKADEELLFVIYNLIDEKSFPKVTAKKNKPISLIACMPDNKGKILLNTFYDFFSYAHNGVIEPKKTYIPKGKQSPEYWDSKSNYSYFKSKNDIVIPHCNTADIDSIFITDAATGNDVFKKTAPPFDTINSEIQNAEILPGYDYQLVIEFKDNSIGTYNFYVFSEEEKNALKK